MARSVSDVENRLYGTKGFYDHHEVKPNIVLEPEIPIEDMVYKIQSSINSKYGAIIYPYNIHKRGSGWALYILKDEKAVSREELRKLAGKSVVTELTEECRRLHDKTDH